MPEGDIGSVQGFLEFDALNGEVPKVLHVSGHVYAIAYRGPDVAGRIKTVTISDDGVNVALAGGGFSFDPGKGDYPDIVHVTGNVYAMVYVGSGNEGRIRTFTISDDGTTIAATGVSLDFDSEWGYEAVIIHVSGNIYAIAYTSTGNDGRIKTVTISDDGLTISLTGGDLIFDSGVGFYPDIIHIASDVYAIAYTGPDGDGWLRTVTISANGLTITLLAGNLEFDTDRGFWPSIIHVINDVYAIAYTGGDDDGWSKAVTISSNGLTLALAGGSLEFDTGRGYTPDIKHVSGTVYAVAYQGGVNEGWLKTITISDDGATISLTSQSLEFDTDVAMAPKIIFVKGNIYAIAYGGPGNDGWIKTIDIETVAAAKVKHLMLMGIG